MTDRFKPFLRDELSPDQKVVFDAIRSGPRGAVPHIFHLLLTSPDLASRVQELGSLCRYGTSLPPRLSELAILIVARHWNADYEWRIHESEARRAGVPGAVIAAVKVGSRPRFEDEDLELLYDFCTQFFLANDVAETLFRRVEARFGRKATIELAAIVGYYSMLAIIIRIFRVPPEP